MESDTTERLNNNQNSYLYQVGANGVEGRVGGVSSERHKNKQLTDSPTDPLCPSVQCFKTGLRLTRALYRVPQPHQMVNTEIRLIILFATKDGEALYSQQKQDRVLTVAQIMNSLLPDSD